jgi:mono/diheme cytochrome c family protein
MRKPLLALLPFLVSASFAAEEKIQFNRDIRPIIADNCFHCHGPDPAARKASLRLDTEAGFFAPRVTKDGKEEPPTIIKGQPNKSTLFQRIISKDEDEIMPPPKEHKTLKPDQVALVRRWIEQGAPWQPHWSLVAPQKAPLPVAADASWAKNPIDRFVAAKLATFGLKPAPEADANALIRRVSLDVIGLPPSPEILAKYLPKDGARLSDAKLTELIDELIAKPAYGEHRARYWLDAARYSDTHGLHFDAYREMWPYRDWVVKAYNRNQPFDQFTVDQLAGDLLPKPTEEQLIATGLQRCNITTNEGGTIVEENLANYAADRVQTMGWVYLGLTTNCAQCHDHKFDPFTAKDFYSMAAFFRNTKQGGLDGNVKDGNGPVLYLPSDTDKPRWLALPTEITSSKAKTQEARNAAKPEFATWLAKIKPADLDADLPTKELLARLALNEGKGLPAGTTANGEPITWKTDGKLGPAPTLKKGSNLVIGELGNFDTKKPFSVGAWIRPTKVEGNGAIVARMDDAKSAQGWNFFQAGKNLGLHVISKWPDDALQVSTTRNLLKAGVWQHVFVTYDGSGKGTGVKFYIDGVLTDAKANIDKLKTSSTSATPTRLGQRSTSEFYEGGIQDVLLYGRPLNGGEVMTISKVGPMQLLLASPKLDQKQKDLAFEYYLTTRHEDSKKATALAAKLEAEQTAIRNRSPLTHIQEEKMDSKPMANILMRGAYDKPGVQVDAEVPAALGKLPADAPRNRLGLARWLVSDANTLTARVTVNRMWQELFGTGIVKTTEDFGIVGSAPSNQELLDWLAVDFREHGWDLKRFYKQVLSSATYRQAAVITSEKLDKDRDNALLSRGPRFRMDAEMIRDYALAASGTLSPRMGGPGTYPYQPENIWEVVGMHNMSYKQDTGENLYRRTVYNFWKRMAAPASLDIFNAPSREMSCVRRDRTNTPLQALVTLNDPQYVESARILAQHTLQSPGDDTVRLHAAATRLLCRPLKAEELPILTDSLTQLRKHYSANAADADALLKVGDSKSDPKLPNSELAAWTMVCSQLLNLDEVLNK